MTGFGLADGQPYSWLIGLGAVAATCTRPSLDTRDEVHGFQDAALAAGATSLRGPAVHPDYYGGFVLDPHGIDLEAVRHHREPR